MKFRLLVTLRTHTGVAAVQKLVELEVADWTVFRTVLIRAPSARDCWRDYVKAHVPDISDAVLDQIIDPSQSYPGHADYDEWAAQDRTFQYGSRPYLWGMLAHPRLIPEVTSYELIDEFELDTEG